MSHQASAVESLFSDEETYWRSPSTHTRSDPEVNKYKLTTTLQHPAKPTLQPGAGLDNDNTVATRVPDTTVCEMVKTMISLIQKY